MCKVVGLGALPEAAPLEQFLFAATFNDSASLLSSFCVLAFCKVQLHPGLSHMAVGNCPWPEVAG